MDQIFKAYDIRGIYPEEINEDIAYNVGRATVKFLKAKELIIGRDNRLSSDSLYKSLIKGITDQGADVINIGITTTPVFYYSSLKGKFKGGIMITSSHNPKEYNGFKIIGKKAISIGQNSGLNKIKRIIEKNKFNDEEKGIVKNVQVIDSYIKNILRFIKVKKIKPLKIVIDTNNGVVGKIIPKLFEKLPCEIIHIFSELDGSFPNHGLNPLEDKNTKAIQEKVLIENADLGVIFDGDADRIVFIDDNGEKIDPDLIATLLVRYFLPNTGKIVHTVTSGKSFRKEIEKTGNEPVWSKVGHTFVQELMRKEKAIFGAESAAHYFLKENNFLESPMIILLKVLEIVSIEQDLSKLIEPFKNYYHERIKINTQKGFKRVIKKIKRKYKKIADMFYLDGIFVERKNWWFNVRLSNTENVIKITIEANSKELLEDKKQELMDLF